MNTTIAKGATTAAALLALLAALPSVVASSATDGCHEGVPEATARACAVERLRRRSFVVVAVVDTGINPYHADFRLPPGDDRHLAAPWEYIEGFPRTADPLTLSLSAPTYPGALAADAGVWSDVKPRRLYHIPGTKIVGAYAFTSPPILDGRRYGGHGTAAASLVAGSRHGFARDPDVLLLAVQGPGPEALAWAAEQPWVDVITNSWAYASQLSEHGGEPEISRQATASGKVVLFAAGNGLQTGAPCDPSLTPTSQTAGPPWVVTVGAVSMRSGRSYCWHSLPPDVSSYGGDVPSADAVTMEGERRFGGTSAATALVAGVFATTILEARRALGDPVEGPHGGGALAVANGGSSRQGPLADGTLERREVEAVVLKTAAASGGVSDPLECTASPEECVVTVPTTPASFVWQGYGTVDGASMQRAREVVLGTRPLPARTEVDAWMNARDAISGAYWWRGELPMAARPSNR